MATTFNIQRFGKCFANEWTINRKKILLLWGGLIGIAFIYFGFRTSMNHLAPVEGTVMLFFLLLLGFQGLITSIHFSEFTSKTKSIFLLLSPASKTEKFTAKLMYTMIIFPLMATLYYCLVLKMNIIYNHWAAEAFNISPLPYAEAEAIKNHFSSHVLLTHYAVWFVAAASFLLGALTYRKLAPVKTFLSVLGFYIATIPLTSLFYYLASGHFPDVYMPFVFIADHAGGYSFIDDCPYYLFWLGLFTGLCLIVVSRIRFNEKTI